VSLNEDEIIEKIKEIAINLTFHSLNLHHHSLGCYSKEMKIKLNHMDSTKKSNILAKVNDIIKRITEVSTFLHDVFTGNHKFMTKPVNTQGTFYIKVLINNYLKILEALQSTSIKLEDIISNNNNIQEAIKNKLKLLLQKKMN